MFVTQHVCFITFTLLGFISYLNTECYGFHSLDYASSDYSTSRMKRQSCEFRCANGECIFRHEQCDGHFDCSDNSDELPEICAAITASVTPPTVPDISCAIPPPPANGKYTAEIIQSLIKLTYSCTTGYQLYPSPNNNVATCEKGKWYPNLSECVRACAPRISDSVDTYCERNGLAVNCSEPMVEGTTVLMSCKHSYSQVDPSANRVSMCKDGLWDYKYIECVPVNPCTLQSNNATGQCVFLKNCPKAIENLQKGIFPQICDYKGLQPVICCAKRVPVEEISKRKCKEYGEHAFEFEYPASLGTNIIPIKIDTCAVRVTPSRISVDDAYPREYPHMALLGYGERNGITWRCSGTVISEQFVLTAGHCLIDRDFGPLRWIRVGELILGSYVDKAQPRDFSVLESIKHPQYLPPSIFNDIALVKVDGQIQFNLFVRPACLHTTTFINATQYIATGWAPTVPGDKRSDALQAVVFDIFPQDRCNTSHETQICAGGNESYGEICAGGVPLQVYSKEVYCMYNIVGVASLGKSCGIPGIPTVFTRVSPYIDWIEKTVWPKKT